MSHFYLAFSTHSPSSGINSWLIWWSPHRFGRHVKWSTWHNTNATARLAEPITRLLVQTVFFLFLYPWPVSLPQCLFAAGIVSSGPTAQQSSEGSAEADKHQNVKQYQMSCSFRENNSRFLSWRVHSRWPSTDIFHVVTLAWRLFAITGWQIMYVAGVSSRSLIRLVWC